MHRIFRRLLSRRNTFCTAEAKLNTVIPPFNLQTDIPCLPLKFPILPEASCMISLPRFQYESLRRLAPHHLTTLLPTTSANSSPSSPLLSQYHRLGTLCQVYYSGLDPVLLLNGLHRVSIQQLRPMSPPSDLSPISRTSLIAEYYHQKWHQKMGSASKVLLTGRMKKLEAKKLEQDFDLETKMRVLMDRYWRMKMELGQLTPEASNLMAFPETVKFVHNVIHEFHKENAVSNEEMFRFLEEDGIEWKVDLLLSRIELLMHAKKNQKAMEAISQKKFQGDSQKDQKKELLRIMREVIDKGKSKDIFLSKCTQQFQNNNPSQDIKRIFNSQRKRFLQMHQNSSQYPISKSYLQQLSKIPYNVKHQQKFNLEEAHTALQQNHYGMRQVKDDILELIAVGKLKGSLKGKALCLIGAPGLGKTTLAYSIAKALGRKFESISLGGVTDSSVLKGHKRTYIGAYPGKIIAALKNCGTSDPVILLDEIDKLGWSQQGDPASQLLQILDPSQNSSFVDNYIDVPVDLSNVLFICSANTTSTISKPLLDRLQKIELSSYTNTEKMEIFHRHILPKALEKTGLRMDMLEISKEVVEMLIHDYSRGEPGVRYLERETTKLLEKVAYNRAKSLNQDEVVQITKENITEYLGQPIQTPKQHGKLMPGVAIGLGDSYYGGRLTYIEAKKRSFNKNASAARMLFLTGSLQNVFKESAEIGYTFARNFLQEKLNNTYLYQNQVHLHAPEGAVKKQGPNDSLAIATALISLAINKPIKSGIALTGQMSLKGRILSVSDCKQKILVAKREKIPEIILPLSNKYDVEGLPSDITSGLKFHFVDTYSDVFEIVFE